MAKTKAKQENKDTNEELKKLLKEIEENTTLFNKDPSYFEKLKQKRRLRTGYTFLDDPENTKTGLYDEDLAFIAGNQEEEHKTTFSMNLAFNLANNYKKRKVYYFFENEGHYTPNKVSNLAKTKKAECRIINVPVYSDEDLKQKLDLLKNQLNEKDIIFIDNFANHIQITNPGSAKAWCKRNKYAELVSKIVLMKQETKTTIVIITNKAKEFKLSNKAKENLTEDAGQEIHGDTIRTYAKLNLYIRLARKKNLIMTTIRKENNYYGETLVKADPNTQEISEVQH